MYPKTWIILKKIYLIVLYFTTLINDLLMLISVSTNDRKSLNGEEPSLKREEQLTKAKNHGKQ